MTEKAFRIEGLKELQDALRAFPGAVQRAVSSGMHGATEIVRGGLADYPPRRHGVKVTFVSDKQRKGFFAKLHAGEIEVPYRRGVSPGSERLGASWTKEVKTLGPGRIKGIVGSRASYGPLVQGDEQTEMHKGTGWKTVEQVLDEKLKDLERFFGQVLQKVLSRITRG
jgi:hypothetical protein